jgi:hypothetical protein
MVKKHQSTISNYPVLEIRLTRHPIGHGGSTIINFLDKAFLWIQELETSKIYMSDFNDMGVDLGKFTKLYGPSEHHHIFLLICCIKNEFKSPSDAYQGHFLFF